MAVAAEIADHETSGVPRVPGATAGVLAPVAPIANASDVAYESIRRALVEGRFAPGERLREVALAQQLGISPTPVREALARLKQEGLIEFEPRRGAVVPQLGPDDVVEVYELREVLEGFAARRAAERHDTAPQRQRLARLAAIVTEAGQLADRQHTPEYNRLDSELHQTLLEMAENQRLLRVYRSVHAQVQAVRRRAIHLPGRPAKSHREHRRIVAAIRAGDADRAEAETRRHIASVKEAVLAQLATTD